MSLAEILPVPLERQKDSVSDVEAMLRDGVRGNQRGGIQKRRHWRKCSETARLLRDLGDWFKQDAELASILVLNLRDAEEYVVRINNNTTEASDTRKDVSQVTGAPSEVAAGGTPNR